MREAVIVSAVRSPVGKRGGVFADLHPVELGAQVLQGLVGRAGISADLVDDVIWGCVGQGGEQSGDIARTTVLAAGWPLEVPGVTIDRQCGSSQQALHFAVAGVVAGHYDAVVAGGVESMTRVPMGSSRGEADNYGPSFLERVGGTRPNQGIGAEMIAEQWDISREDCDALALESHSRAARAQDSGAFDEQIVAITTPDGTVVTQDEGVRRGGTMDRLAGLKPAFADDGLITAANSSQMSDGAAAILVMSRELADEHGLTPIARVHTVAVVGSEPVLMLTGPIPATRKALDRSGLSLGDIDTFEVNEAFAPVALAWTKEFGADPDKVNPDGGAIALGHPLGGSGARLMTTMIHRMRREGLRYGLQTMCEGGGQANATIIEAL
ncbi:acetyl-CoA acetyltransferase [Janibacter sp. Soil728]|uniref:thiolase family protein n=1 Tax=Janibacter sp. Soil728 TaxID=1736393 RepID=UPI000700966B|nr:thiolase family protein [Janibacter sp. Soil728]KRE39626.1 acetyl-CoA acetyltransferase [Janibacter sp. Soil728]